MSEIPKRLFPSPIAPDSEKRTPEYGLMVARAAYQGFDMANIYIRNRNASYIQNRQFGKGIQPMDPYLDLMGIDGKNSFTNIDFSATPIVSGFRRTVVGGYMNRKEQIICRAMNKTIVDRKNNKFLEAKFRMEQKDFINEVAQSGVQMFDEGEYTPETQQELDLWKDMMPREREELLMELAVAFCFEDNKMDSIKEKSYANLFDCNFAGTYMYTEPSGRLRIKYLRPEDCIYGPSDENDFSDIQYAGHLIKMKISEARVMFGDQVSEKQYYELAKTYCSVYQNQADLTEFNNLWYTSAIRPYDDWVVNILHVWYKTVNGITYVEGTDKRGRSIFDIQEIKSPITSETKKSGVKEKETAYEGYWFIGSEIIADWGESQNLIRYDTRLDKVQSPYTFYMPENDGSMDTPSMTRSIIGSVKQMDIALLKMQQIKAKVAPDGWDIDISGLSDVNLGLGKENTDAMDLISIKRQTGDGFWNSKNPDGSSKTQSPYTWSASSIAAALQPLMTDYNFHLQNIRDFLKVNEARDGSSVNPRLGVGIFNQQQEASNNATYHIYMGWMTMYQQMAKKALQRIWDCLKYAENIEGYKGILGEENIDFIREAKSLTDNNYDILVEASMSLEDRNFLEQNIQACLAEKTITLADAVAIREINNTKLAYRYLVVSQERQAKRAEQTAQRQSEYNAQIQAQVVEQSAAAEAQLLQIKEQGETYRKTIELMSQTNVEYQKFLQTAQIEAVKLGIELPEYLQMEVIREMEAQKQADLKQEQAIAQQEQAEAEEQEAQMMQQQEQEQGAEQPTEEQEVMQLEAGAQM